MQCFFALSYSGIDATTWSAKKFHAAVTAHIDALPGVQKRDLAATTRWNMYLALIPVASQADALALRKEIERLCSTVAHGCRPFYFRFRNADVASVDELSITGLTTSETKVFNEKAPAGTRRFINV
jgi:hypothetical protein